MNVHDPKVHTTAIAGLAIIVAGAVGFGGSQIGRIQSIPATYTLSDAQLDSIPFGKHPYTVFSSPNSGQALPDSIADAIERAGGSARIDDDMIGHGGIWVSPDTPDGHAVADAISKEIGEPVKVGNADNGAFEIGVGHPLGKRGRP